jgi:hypothetical protein
MLILVSWEDSHVVHKWNEAVPVVLLLLTVVQRFRLADKASIASSLFLLDLLVFLIFAYLLNVYHAISLSTALFLGTLPFLCFAAAASVPGVTRRYINPNSPLAVALVGYFLSAVSLVKASYDEIAFIIPDYLDFHILNSLFSTIIGVASVMIARVRGSKIILICSQIICILASLFILVFLEGDPEKQSQLSAILGFLIGFVAVVGAVLANEGKTQKGSDKYWRIFIDDQSAAIIRRMFLRIRDTFTNFPIGGFIISFAALFVKALSHAFSKKTANFGQVAVVTILWIQFFLFRGAMKTILFSIKYQSLPLIATLKQSSEWSAINASIDLSCFSLFGIICFGFSSLVGLSFLRTLSLLIPVITTISFALHSAFSGSIRLWPSFVVAFCITIIGARIVRRSPVRF